MDKTLYDLQSLVQQLSTKVRDLTCYLPHIMLQQFVVIASETKQPSQLLETFSKGNCSKTFTS